MKSQYQEVSVLRDGVEVRFYPDGSGPSFRFYTGPDGPVFNERLDGVPPTTLDYKANLIVHVPYLRIDGDCCRAHLPAPWARGLLPLIHVRRAIAFARGDMGKDVFRFNPTRIVPQNQLQRALSAVVWLICRGWIGGFPLGPQIGQNDLFPTILNLGFEGSEEFLGRLLWEDRHQIGAWQAQAGFGSAFGSDVTVLNPMPVLQEVAAALAPFYLIPDADIPDYPLDEWLDLPALVRTPPTSPRAPACLRDSTT